MTPDDVVRCERFIQCRECREWFEETFFRIDRSARIRAVRKARCKRCEQNRRDAAKVGTGRFLKKAHNTITHHAQRFIHKGLITARTELIEVYGWDPHRLAHDAEHAFANSCPYCDRPFASMPNGVSNLVLDMVSHGGKPYYIVNGKWCCKTCNQKKQQTPPEQWARDRLNWKRADKAAAAITEDPYGDSLFAGFLKGGKLIKV